MPRCTLHESDDRHWLRALALYAKHSDDPNTQNAAGAVSSPDCRGDGFRGIGVNWLPGNIPKVAELVTGPRKCDWIIHAEVSAIIDAGGMARGGTLYALWAACPACAVAIVEAGISRVVTLQATQDATPERWRAKVATGLEILRAGGVEVEFFTGRLDTTIRFDGKELHL